MWDKMHIELKMEGIIPNLIKVTYQKTVTLTALQVEH